MTFEQQLAIAAILVSVLAPLIASFIEHAIGPATVTRARRLRISTSAFVAVAVVTLAGGAGALSLWIGLGAAVWLHQGLDADETRTVRQFWSEVWRHVRDGWSAGG